MSVYEKPLTKETAYKLGSKMAIYGLKVGLVIGAISGALVTILVINLIK